jgi:hypothetical protein
VKRLPIFITICISLAFECHFCMLAHAAKNANAQASLLPRFANAVQTGTIECKEINEASGIAASRKNAGVLWVHNDSGDTARVFALTTTGRHLGTYNLSGVSVIDCEDIAVGPGPVRDRSYIYLADIGDNNAVRTEVVVYRVEEPAVSVNQQPITVDLTNVETFRLKYEDGARDAETLMVDTNGDLYIISKREIRSRLYRVAASELTKFGTAVLRFKTELPWGWATAGDILSDGSEIVVRGYNNVSVWHRPSGSNLWEAFKGKEHKVPVATEPQGEAIAYATDGLGYYTVSEGLNQPIYYYKRLDSISIQ